MADAAVTKATADAGRRMSGSRRIRSPMRSMNLIELAKPTSATAWKNTIGAVLERLPVSLRSRREIRGPLVGKGSSRTRYGVYGFGFLAGAGANRGSARSHHEYRSPWVTQAPGCAYASYEWLTDTLAATSTAGAIEGDDWTYSTATTRPVRRLSRTQIFRKDIGVSDPAGCEPAGFRRVRVRGAEGDERLARNLEATPS
jgi:hypothetical protein